MRVVLDTNVLVSAIFYSGLPSKILSAWLEDRFDLVVSEEILGEYDRAARRFGFNYKLTGFGERFETQSGYVPRSNIVEGARATA